MAVAELVGFAEDAKRGELSAISAAIDWLNERNQPGDAFLAFGLEVAYSELEREHSRARQVRRVLERLASQPQPVGRGGPQNEESIQNCLSEFGISVDVTEAVTAWVKMRTDCVADEVMAVDPLSLSELPEGFCEVDALFVRCPTDGQEEDSTGAVLFRFLGCLFPDVRRQRVIIHFCNHPSTAAGWHAWESLGWDILEAE